MINLLYFSDFSQFKDVQTNNPAWLKHNLPITGDMTVAFELERLGLDFIYEWNFLSFEDIKINADIAHSLVKSWWAKHLASTQYEGFSLIDAAQQDLIYPFVASLNARTVYGRLFDTYSVGAISGYFLPSVAVVRTGPFPTSKAVQSVSQAILFYMADQRGIQVNHLTVKLP
jgi:hypothetical protein